jgi:diaminopimelate decarboxylase
MAGAPIEFSQHAPVDAFEVVDGELALDGVPLGRLAARAGGTPFYAYGRSAIRRRVAEVRAALPEGVLLHYAVKANPMPALVQLLASLTDGLDVASAAEMLVALDAGVAPADVSFAGPGKGPREIEQAVAAGIVLNLESEAQALAAIAAARRLAVAPKLAIRVNPAFELKGSGMRMGGGPKPFGVDEARVPDLVRSIEAEGVGVTGFHLFWGSQNLNAQAIAEAQRRSVELGLALAAQCRVGAPEWLNIGGGFGVPYFPGEKHLDLGQVGEALAPLAQRARAEVGVPLVIELGRYLVAEAGVYVCRVLERKESQGQSFVVTDGGLHHHLAASGNFGQVIRKNYPVAIGNRIAEAAREVQSVVGPLCTPLDLLADRMELPLARPGDLVVVFRSGAYGLTASPTRFLSHPAPVEMLV